MKDISHITKEDFYNAIITKITNVQITKELGIGYAEFEVLQEKYDLRVKDIVTKEMRRKAIRKQIEETSMERYGVSNGAKSKEARQKISDKAYKKDLSHITKEILIEAIKTFKTIPKIISHFDIQRHMLDVLLKKYNLLLEQIVTEEEMRNAIQKYREETILEKFGATNPMHSPEVLEKFKKTNRERYGQDFLFGSEYFKEKRKETMTEKYGTEHALNNPDIKEQSKQTSLQKYGTSNPSLNKEIKDKQTQTMIDRYGAKTTFEVPELVEKRNKTWMENHGVDNPWKSGEVQQKTINTKLKNGTLYRSEPEREIEAFIKSVYSGEVRHTCRDIIKNSELDIYIPTHKLAIEFNGSYWHSTEHNLDKSYHYNKSIAARNQGIRLIHIYEWEWNNPRIRPILESILSIALGANVNRIYARQCEVRPVDNKTYREFIIKNHLQGYRSAEVKLGLYYKDELVQLMSFGHRIHQQKSKKDINEWEIVRGCPGSNNLVVGGVSKLFTHFIREYNPVTIFSFGDFNKFSGEGYEAIGMKLKELQPNNRWFVNKETDKVSNWLFRDKVKRERLLNESFEVYGAGNLVYVWNRE